MHNTTTETSAQPNNPYDIYQTDGPFNPSFMREAVRTLFRTLPLDDEEPKPWADRRMHAALLGLSALHPRDEIEVMLSVQAVASYHAAAAGFRLGMNLRRPHGESTRHVTSACSAARTFDTMLRALERRQAKPLSRPAGRPESQTWPHAPKPSAIIATLEQAVRTADDEPKPAAEAIPDIEWTPEALALAEDLLQQARTNKENEGLDIANTEGILPGGGMIVMDDPTQNQMLYMGRRLALMYRREYDENLRKGINKYPRIRGIRTGDLIP